MEHRDNSAGPRRPRNRLLVFGLIFGWIITAVIAIGYIALTSVPAQPLSQRQETRIKPRPWPWSWPTSTPSPPPAIPPATGVHPAPTGQAPTATATPTTPAPSTPPATTSEPPAEPADPPMVTTTPPSSVAPPSEPPPSEPPTSQPPSPEPPAVAPPRLAPPAAPAAPPPSPFEMTKGFYVSPDTAAATWTRNNPDDWRAGTIRDTIASTATARWFQRPEDAQQVRGYVDAAAAAGQLPVLAAYQLTDRDCSNFSLDGAPDADTYRKWISTVAESIGTRPAVVILEANSLMVMPCLPWRFPADRRLELVREGLATLKAKAPNSYVYLDAGAPARNGSLEPTAEALAIAGIADARGFVVNVGDFADNNTARGYSAALSRLLASRYGLTGAKFVIDTSRNGNGSNGQWCNPRGRRLGQRPTYAPEPDGLDATLWIKSPGESDGSCGAAPFSRSGDFVPEVAYRLASGS